MADPTTKQTYKTAVIAALLMITSKQVQELTSRGFIPRIGRNEYDLQASVQGYVKYLKDMIPGNRAMSSNTEINDFKARKAKSDAENSEIDLMRKKKELLLASEIEASLSDMLIVFKTSLRNIPERVAIQLAGEIPDDIVKKIVLEEVDICLTELSAGLTGITKEDPTE